MANGGKRPGAGRKTAAERGTGKEVRATSAQIDRLQPLACRTLAKAMEAKKWVNVVDPSRQTTNGGTCYRSIEVPDHDIRVRASSKLLDKRHADPQRITLEGGAADKPLRIAHRADLENLSDDELNRLMDEAKKG